MNLSSPPKVSVVLPVYNGENFLEEAIQSILAQNFTDFELVLCDNASTDQTGTICQKYAAADARVVYHRNPKNLGMTANFNKAMALGRGEYIKVATHDDIIAPEFLSACVEVLDQDPSLILCHTGSKVIDSAGQMTSGLNGKKEACVEFMNLPSLPEMSSDRPWVRFYAHTCKALAWTQEFALIRREILYKAGMYGYFFANDKVLVANLALLGRFHTIERPLFFYRRHDAQSINMGRSKHLYALWFNQNDVGKLIFPSWRILSEYWQGIQTMPLKPIDRFLCTLCLIPAAARDSVGLTEDIVVAVIQVLDKLLRNIRGLMPKHQAASHDAPLFGRIPRLN